VSSGGSIGFVSDIFTILLSPGATVRSGSFEEKVCHKKAQKAQKMICVHLREAAADLNVRRIHLVPLGDHLVGAAQDGAWARTVSLSDQAFAFHHVEDRGGAAVTDA